MIKVCFVCTGGTCRSIMAERLMKKIVKEKQLSDVRVSSRGLYANGENIADNAKKVLKRFKANAANHKAVKLKKIDKDTLYVVMNERMKDMISSSRVITMKSLVGADISDPYLQSEEVYFQTAIQILEGINNLINKILVWRAK